MKKTNINRRAGLGEKKVYKRRRRGGGKGKNSARSSFKKHGIPGGKKEPRECWGGRGKASLPGGGGVRVKTILGKILDDAGGGTSVEGRGWPASSI